MDAVAKHPYQPDPTIADAIVLGEGDHLTGVQTIGNGWSSGTKANGLKGIFPTSYVELLPQKDHAQRQISASPKCPPPPPASPATGFPMASAVPPEELSAQLPPKPPVAHSRDFSYYKQAAASKIMGGVGNKRLQRRSQVPSQRTEFKPAALPSQQTEFKPAVLPSSTVTSGAEDKDELPTTGATTEASASTAAMGLSAGGGASDAEAKAELAKQPSLNVENDKLIAEIEHSVREWRGKLMVALKDQEFTVYYRVKNQITTLLEWRRQLRDPKTQHDWVRQQVIKLIESRRQMDEAFTVPRTEDNDIATIVNSTITELHDKHKLMEQRMLDGANLPASALEQYRLEEEKGYRPRVGKSSEHRSSARGGSSGPAASGAESSTGPAKRLSHVFVHSNTAIFRSPDPVQMLFSLWAPANQGGPGPDDFLPGNVRLSAIGPLAAAQDGSTVGDGDFVQISEDFSVLLTSKGMPSDVSLMESLQTVFRDVERNAIASKMFLVCRVYRLGLIHPPSADKSKGGQGGDVDPSDLLKVDDNQPIFRRNFGVGVVDLSQYDLHAVDSGTMVEMTMRLYQPNGSVGEFGFPTLHHALMSGVNPAEAMSDIPLCTGIAMRLSVFDGSLADLRAKGVGPFADPNLTLTKRFLHSNDDLDPSEDRNDMYLSLVRGSFSRDNKKAPKNIEVKVSYLLDTGSLVEALVRGEGRQAVPTSTYRTAVYYHKDDPTFHETVRLAIPPNNFERSHLVFVISHSKDEKKSSGWGGKSGSDARSPGSFAFLPLTTPENGSVISDGEHHLTCYKLLPGMERGQFSPTYLSDPTKLVEHKLRWKDQNEELVVSTRLISTKKTQIKELHELINWRQLDAGQLVGVLKGVTKAPWNDIFKLLYEVLDATIELLNVKINNKRELLPTFYFFSFLLDQFTLEQNSACRPALMAYVARSAGHFKRLHHIIVACLRKYLTWVGAAGEDPTKPLDDPDGLMRRGLFCSLSSLHLLMTFVTASYQQEAADPEYVADLERLIDEVITLMTQSEPRWIKQPQQKTLRQLWPALLNLKDILSVDTAAEKVSEAIDALQASSSGSDSLRVDRLLFVRNIVLGHIMLVKQPRLALMPSILEILKTHLKADGQPRELALVIVNDLLNVVQRAKRLDSESTDSVETQMIAESALPDLLTAVMLTMDDAADQDHSRQSNNGAVSARDLLLHNPKLSKLMKLDEAGDEGPGGPLRKNSGLMGSFNFNKPKHKRVRRSALEQGVDRTSATMIAALIECNIKPVSDAATALLSLLYMMFDPAHGGLMVQDGDNPAKSALTQCLPDLLAALKAMLMNHIYAKDWLVMNMLQYEITVKVLQFFAGHRKSQSQVNPVGAGGSGMSPTSLKMSVADADSEQLSLLDDMFFEIGLTLLREEALDLTSSSMTEARRHFIQDVGQYGDMRLSVVSVLESCWADLTTERLLLIDRIVKPLLELVNSSCPEVVSMAEHMFYEILKDEFRQTSSFRNVGSHTIDAVDAIITAEVNAAKDNEESSLGSKTESPLLVLFRDDLVAKFEHDPVLNVPAAKQFLTETTELFTLLKSLGVHPKTAEFEDDRVYAYIKLMEFLERLDRTETYIKYAHHMSKEMAALGHHVEAANALLLHAKHLKVDTEPEPDEVQEALGWPADIGVGGHVTLSVPITPYHGDCRHPAARAMLDELDIGTLHFPKQTAIQRRETLYAMAMDLFDKGQQWESALVLAQGIQRQLSTVTFDFEKLGALLNRMAQWYDNVRTVERYYPSVFRVGYYGKHYPPELKNQEFVYRGAPLEQIIDFTTRIKMKFPKCVTLGVKVDPNPEEHFEADEYFIQISKLTPATRPEMVDLPPSTHVTDPVLSNTVKAWRMNNDVDTFFYTRPYNKRKQMGMPKSPGQAGEFLDLWVEKKLLRVGRPFPNVQRRAVVVETATVYKNPIETAIETMTNKNAELEEKINQMKLLEDGGADQSYTMTLNGVVDAAVNGGVKNYSSFITGLFRTDNPEIAEDIDSSDAKRQLPAKLADSLRKQMQLLQWGIGIHSHKVCEAMKPLGELMETNHVKLRAEMQELLDQAQP